MWEWLKALFKQSEPEDDTSTYPDEPDVPPSDFDCPDTQPSQPGALGP